MASPHVAAVPCRAVNWNCLPSHATSRRKVASATRLAGLSTAKGTRVPKGVQASSMTQYALFGSATLLQTATLTGLSLRKSPPVSWCKASAAYVNKRVKLAQGCSNESYFLHRAIAIKRASILLSMHGARTSLSPPQI